jgi:dipeptidyl aminopeptidase/acylaminoacyl peptidase
MTAPITAAYGTWTSPITAQRVAAGSTPLSAPRIDGDALYWLEGVPAEGGRVVAVRSRSGAAREVITPAGFNVRTRVHEYGGGAYAIADGRLYFSNFSDNLVYVQESDAAPRALTSDGAQRHADFEVDARRRRLIAVREHHVQPGQEPVNSLVSLPATPGQGEAAVLVSGFDFYAAPRLSPDGTRLAWLCWNHPLMPWMGTELWFADVADDGRLVAPRKLAGGPDVSLMQPLWSPDGALHVVSDHTGWWNLYRVEPEGLNPVCPMSAEFARPHWIFGQSLYGFSGPQEIIAAYVEQGVSRLIRIDLAGKRAHPIVTEFSDVPELRVGAGVLLALASSPTQAEQVVCIDATSGRHTELARSASDVPEPRYLSVPDSLAYPSAKGRTAHAFFYPPSNGDFVAPAGELPPLIVTSHGGPTSMANSSLKLTTQYWTSRGFAVLDVNYGGSTGYGRAYMSLLNGEWGVVDVEDCVAGARHLVERGLVDARRLAIRGGSASGFTTLSALAFHDLFKAGASYYGVSDLKGLDDDTHKFESHYTQSLVAPPPQRERLYAQRSPILHADKISCPVIFFQGLDDKVVLPSQSETMVAALQARGVPVAYLAFEGEGHGFRRLDTIRRTLEAELSFYAQVFGFRPAGDIEPVALQ